MKLELYNIEVEYDNGDTEHFKAAASNNVAAQQILLNSLRNVKRVAGFSYEGKVIVDDRKDWT